MDSFDKETIWLCLAPENFTGAAAHLFLFELLMAKAKISQWPFG